MVVKNEPEDSKIPIVKKTKKENASIRCSEHLNGLVDVARNAGVTFDSLEVKLTEEELAHTVSRLFIAQHFGGSPQGARQYAKDHNIRFHFADKERNTYLPSRPGDPGLFFDGHANIDEDLSPDPRYTFIRLGANSWHYLGNYKIKNVTTVTRDEWNLQSDAFKAVWTTSIHQAKTWGKDLRKVIKARNLFREENAELERDPTRDELEERKERVSEAEINSVSVAEIKEAYDSGRQVLWISTLTFVGYDEAFQRTLIEKSRPVPRARAVANDGVKKRKSATAVIDFDAAPEGDANGDGDTISSRVSKRRRNVR
ncbi:hypothetical protein EXIGLDRAFT_694231 [Exidia glandulosa HHB12029]|uniref:DUF6697 domain-containing protein n=1 Tax=Exidia glandulosa HHB12029 TaxID=1314781 RepID=A0A165GQL2_EXIGL|nr:hypothetical protein EXIGLDRAFT_694231 [Exidia glandulosa HHB12029]